MNAWPPIEEVLPHRGTMLLLDAVEDYAPTPGTPTPTAPCRPGSGSN